MLSFKCKHTNKIILIQNRFTYPIPYAELKIIMKLIEHF